MKPTTLLVLFVAVVVGLGATAAARSAGLFAPPAAAAPAGPPAEINVVVAARNVFQDSALDSAAVKTRPLRADERAAYDRDRDQYLTAPAAVGQRIAARHLEADRPVRRDDLKPLARPDPVHARLRPNTRAVVVGATKERSAGGLIQVGEWVDVMLTTECTAPGRAPATHTAVLAAAARVVVKRDNLQPLPVALPADGTPIRFTLEVTPGQAALIDYARTKGVFTLVPRPEADTTTRRESETDAVDAAADSPVGDADLMRLLGLTPAAPPVAIDLIVGKERRTVVFPAGGEDAGGNYTFAPPAEKPADAVPPSDKPADRKSIARK